MNIFTALSPRGDNKLRETNLSAILAYFLDPAKDHGLGGLFLSAFLDLVESKTAGVAPDKTCVETEQPQKDDDGNMYFDVVVELRGKNDDVLHVLVVENKIKSGAANAKQLNRYYKEARKQYGKETGITMVFLTPESGQSALKEEYDNLSSQDGGDDKKWLLWSARDKDAGEKRSVQAMIRREILRKESGGEISPINEYAKHTLKAFAVHLDTLLSKESSGDMRGADDYEESEVISVTGMDYQIVTTNRGSYVYVRSKESGEKVVAKPALRKINEELKLGVDIRRKDGALLLTTHELGRAVIKALAEREKKNKT